MIISQRRARQGEGPGRRDVGDAGPVAGRGADRAEAGEVDVAQPGRALLAPVEHGRGEQRARERDLARLQPGLLREDRRRDRPDEQRRRSRRRRDARRDLGPVDCRKHPLVPFSLVISISK